MDRVGEATTLNNIGMLYGSPGEVDQALAHYEQALPIRRVVGDRIGQAVTHFNIGIVRETRRELAEAAAALERAVELDELVRHPELESHRTVLENVRKERDATPRSSAQHVMRPVDQIGLR